MMMVVMVIGGPAEEENIEQNAGSGCPENPSFHWTYENTADWYTCPSWSACANGAQSPINIVTSSTTALKLDSKFVSNYDTSLVGNITNTGHSVQVKIFATNNTISGGPLGTRQFRLLQFHWHSPAEHQLNGIAPVLELHAVHQNVNNDSEIAVVSTMYSLTANESEVHSFLRIVFNTLPADTHDFNETQWEAVWATTGFNAFSNGIAEDPDLYFYTYLGSLTTPPCSGPVVWLIHPRMQYTTQTILDFIRAQVSEANARPVQPLNGRALEKYSTFKYLSGSSSLMWSAPTVLVAMVSALFMQL